MSLYAFGKVIDDDRAVLAATLVSVGKSNSVVVELEDLDKDDKDAMERVPLLRRAGVVFSIASGPGETDAIGLWNEAFDALREVPCAPTDDPDSLPMAVVRRFLDVRLGRTCFGLLSVGKVASIALVDGGIDDVFVASLDKCLRRMAIDVCQPWDQSPNRIYVRTGTV